MFKNLLLEEAEDNWSSGGHDEGDIQVSISDFDSPNLNIQNVTIEWFRKIDSKILNMQKQILVMKNKVKPSKN